MKFLREFETESAYNAEKDNLDLPNVSYVVESQNNYFHPYIPQRDYSREYLTYEVLEDGLLGLFVRKEGDAPDVTVSYSINDGEWSTLPIIVFGNTGSCIEVSEGDVIRFKGNNNAFYYYDNETENVCFNEILLLNSTLTSAIGFNAYGNIMSVIYGDNFIGQTSFPNGSSGNLKEFFEGLGIVDASHLTLPVTALTDACYNMMFQHCSSLTNAPVLPATTLAEDCYVGMFQGCTSLVTAPSLPATTLTNNCYSDMFVGCTLLVNAPELPATTLANYCYMEMFNGCTALETAPSVLPALTLVNNCYSSMFGGCSSLVNAPELPATTMANNCYSGMFGGCTSLVNAPELPATTLVQGCYSYMFRACRSLVNAPELPATTLAQNCYEGMFRGCTSLVNVTELPATTLAQNCYAGMFMECSSLNYIKCLATDISATDCTSFWVFGVAASGTFVKAEGVTWPTGDSGIPNGWTVVDAS